MKMLIEKINLPLIEIPNNKDNKNTIEFLHTVLKLKKELKLKKWNFSLKVLLLTLFRKLVTCRRFYINFLSKHVSNMPKN